MMIIVVVVVAIVLITISIIAKNPYAKMVIFLGQIFFFSVTRYLFPFHSTITVN